MADTLNWAKLPELQVYNSATMKVCPQIDNSILGIVTGTVITPDACFADTTKYEDKFILKVFTNRYRDKYPDMCIDASILKEEFSNIMRECVTSEPKRFAFEHPDFFWMLDGGIVSLCNLLNQPDIDDIFIRADKKYILSNSVGYVYDGSLPVGIFSGITLKASMSQEGMRLQIVIPNLVLNPNINISNNAVFVYKDTISNLEIQFNMKYLAREDNEWHVICKRSLDVVSFNAIAKNRNVCITDNDPALFNKELKLPMTNLDFRLLGLMGRRQDIETSSSLPVKSMMMRMTKLRR